MLHPHARPESLSPARVYELHVWAWEHNPSGSFADWNNEVTCEAQPLG